jgi:hypothetical protein
MVLNLELQIDKAMYTSRSWLMLLLQMVARLSDIGKNYHVPSSPPPFEPISTVFSLGSMNAPSYLHGAVTPF